MNLGDSKGQKKASEESKKYYKQNKKNKIHCLAHDLSTALVLNDSDDFKIPGMSVVP
jgi:hypothetical protein